MYRTAYQKRFIIEGMTANNITHELQRYDQLIVRSVENVECLSKDLF